MIVIPAIDVRAGRCVRLEQGDPSRERVYAADPVTVARDFARQGAAWLHVVDLDGAAVGRPVHRALMRRLARSIPAQIQVGGGFRTLEDIAGALRAGIARVVLGTAARALMAEATRRFGERVCAAVDVVDRGVAVRGWQVFLPEDPVRVGQELVAMGVRRIIYTAVARDGMLQGPDLQGVRRFVEAVGVPVLAAGGVASQSDLEALAETGAEGAIVGRALYEGRLTLGPLARAGGSTSC